MHPVKMRPRLWVRLLQFTYMQRGRHSVIYRSVRKDIPPFNKFRLGAFSVIEDFTTINNAVGDLIIGSHSRIGLGNTVIGPVTIGDRVHVAQNVVITGLNHNFQDVSTSIDRQGVATKEITIADDVWIGANAVILPGVSIGQHSVIAAGSVVTRSVPPYSVCAGNPAHIVKQYDAVRKEWVKIEHRPQ
jgi:acetyltransferase-like isoleucine patch superfamily enzyme